MSVTILVRAIIVLTFGMCGDCRATQEDELGELYLTNVDFLKNGVPSSIIATLVGSRFILVPDWLTLSFPLLLQVVATLGFVIMKLIG